MRLLPCGWCRKLVDVRERMTIQSTTRHHQLLVCPECWQMLAGLESRVTA